MCADQKKKEKKKKDRIGSNVKIVQDESVCKNTTGTVSVPVGLSWAACNSNAKHGKNGRAEVAHAAVTSST